MPASLEYVTLDVFTKVKYEGNPLAVVHLPSSVVLTQAQKQTIAREFNYSETVFLHLPPTFTSSSSSTTSASTTQIPSYKLDIFTVEEELPFAGHPTIGTACHVLSSLASATAHNGSDNNSKSDSSSNAESNESDSIAVPSTARPVRARFQVKAGTLELEYDDGVARAGIPHDVHIHSSHTLTAEEVLDWQPQLASFLAENKPEPNAGAGAGAAGGNSADGEMPPPLLRFDVVSPVKGMSFAMVALPSLQALARVQTAGRRLSAQLDEGWNFGPLMCMFYVRLPSNSSSSSGDGVQRFRTRMVEGSFEDPATGSASVGLAAMTALQEKREGRTRFEMVQGVEIGRRSEIGVEIVVEKGRVKTAELVGSSVVVMEGRVFYE